MKKETLNFRTYNVAFKKYLKNSSNEFQSGKKRKGFRLKRKKPRIFLAKNPSDKNQFFWDGSTPFFIGLETLFSILTSKFKESERFFKGIHIQPRQTSTSNKYQPT
jgi:hypothetical protein